MFKNVVNNVDKLYIGQKCRVKSNSRWWGADTTEPFVWLCGKIVNINWGKNDCFKTEYGVPSLTINIRRSHKYKTPSLPSLTCLPTQLVKDEIVKIEL